MVENKSEASLIRHLYIYVEKIYITREYIQYALV